MKYRSVVDRLEETVSVIPSEETWQASDAGTEISLSYLTIKLPIEQIAQISNPYDATVQIILQTGVVLVFLPPVSIPPQATAAAQGDRPFDFDWQKSICYVQPVGSFDFIRLDKESRSKHYEQIINKGNNLFNNQGIVIFDAPYVQGILHRGDPRQSKMLCEIWNKNKNIYQAVAIVAGEEGFTVEREKLSQAIIASIEYKIDTVPKKTELQQGVLDSIKSLPGFVEMQKPQIQEQP